MKIISSFFLIFSLNLSIGNWHNMRIFFDLSPLNQFQTQNTTHIRTIKYIKEYFIPSSYEYFNQIFQVREDTRIDRNNISNNCRTEIAPTNLTEEGLAYDYYMFTIVFNNSTSTFAGLAANCNNNRETNRPTIGVFYLNLAHLNVENTNFLQIIRFAMIHEIMHALGFSSRSIPFFVDSNLRLIPTSNNLITENDLVYFKGNRVINFAKRYFNCDTINRIGFEDNGAVQSRGQHWEFIEIGYEIMVAGLLFGMRVSGFTLNFFQESGWYNINFDYSQKLLWGNNRGCSFYTNLNSKPEFCNSDNFCSLDYLGLSTCRARTFSGTKKINFSSSSFCYIKNSSLDVIYNNHDSRCLVTKNSNTFTSNCYKSYCINNGRTAVFENQNNEKINCVNEGELIVGGETFICPNITKFCELRYECKNSCSGNGTCYNGNCICFPKFAGLACEYQIGATLDNSCSNNCNNNGSCVNGTCNCFDNYNGSSCENIINNVGSFGSNCSNSLYSTCYKKLNDKILTYNFIKIKEILLVLLIIKLN